MKIGKGAILGLIGGLLGLVGVFLPWFTVSALGVSFGFTGLQLASATIDVGGVPFPNPYANVFSIAVYGTIAFSVLGLIVVMLGKKITAILAALFGVLTLAMAGLGAAQATALAATIPPGIPVTAGAGVGIYLSIVGGLLLLIGGILAIGDAKKAMMSGAPMPMAPPMPPPQ